MFAREARIEGGKIISSNRLEIAFEIDGKFLEFVSIYEKKKESLRIGRNYERREKEINRSGSMMIFDEDCLSRKQFKNGKGGMF